MTLDASAAALTGAAASLEAAASLGAKGAVADAAGKIATAETAEAATAAVAATGSVPALGVGALGAGAVLAGVGGSAVIAGKIMDDNATAPDHRKWDLGRLWHNFTTGGDTTPSASDIDKALNEAVAKHVAEKNAALDAAGIGRIGGGASSAKPVAPGVTTLGVAPNANLPTFAHGGPAELARQLSPQKIDVSSNVTVQGDVKGEAMLTVRVDPSPYFDAKVNAPRVVPMTGKLGQTMSGSNAAKSSAPSFTGFQPTMSGR